MEISQDEIELTIDYKDFSSFLDGDMTLARYTVKDELATEDNTAASFSSILMGNAKKARDGAIWRVYTDIREYYNPKDEHIYFVFNVDPWSISEDFEEINGKRMEYGTLFNTGIENIPGVVLFKISKSNYVDMIVDGTNYHERFLYIYEQTWLNKNLSDEIKESIVKDISEITSIDPESEWVIKDRDLLVRIILEEFEELNSKFREFLKKSAPLIDSVNLSKLMNIAPELLISGAGLALQNQRMGALLTRMKQEKEKE